MESKELKGYIANTKEVSEASTYDLDIVKTNGEAVNFGWITSDDGEIFVQVNDIGALKIILQAGDTINFEIDEQWILKRIIITTDSVADLTVRYFFKNTLKIDLLKGE